MANRLYKQFQATLEQGVVELFGSVTTSTSGTILSATGKGLTITKVGGKSGRYLVTLADKYTSLLGVDVIVEGAADAAYSSSKGLIALVRASAVSAAIPSFDVQFVGDTFADAELDDAAKFYLQVKLKNSSAY